MKIKIIRISTIPLSLNILLKGQLRFLSKFFEVIGISSSGEDLEEVHQREGIKTIAVDMERGISPLKDIISLFKLYKQFKREKPIIVHSITPKAGLLSMLAGKMTGIPVRIHTFTGLIFPTKTGLIQRVLIAMDRLLCWSATNIYPEGNGVKNDLINYKITSKPLKVLAEGNVNGIDLDYYNPSRISETQRKNLKQQLGIKKEVFVFIFVGRLVGDKGINELVQAFKQTLSHSNPQTSKLLLVGPLESELDPLQPEILTEIETNPDIISVGYQKDVRPYFAIADVLVFPSYREGFPNVVIQAGAMELPSIVSDINGCNEIVVKEKNGIIIPAKDSEALFWAMQKIMNDKSYYEQLKANVRPMIESRYEQKVVWGALLEEYNQLIEKYKKAQNSNV